MEKLKNIPILPGLVISFAITAIGIALHATIDENSIGIIVLMTGAITCFIYSILFIVIAILNSLEERRRTKK